MLLALRPAGPETRPVSVECRSIQITLPLSGDPGRTLPALSLWQPWATLVAIGAKRNETRSWSTTYKGPLAIHATKGHLDREVLDAEPFRRALAGRELPRGVVLAIVWLDGCVRTTSLVGAGLSDQGMAFGDYTSGRWAWLFARVIELSQTVPARGAQGLWTWESPCREALDAAAQLREWAAER
jgi:activating signal cointegrator 1